MGVWAPKHWDLSIHALAQYTVPKIPPENPWVDRTRSRPGTPRPSTPSPSSTSPLVPAQTIAVAAAAAQTIAVAAAAAAAHVAPTPAPAPPAKKGHKRPPSRRLVRHVLRARIDAAKSLSTLFEQLELAPEGKRVRASSHLARAHGGEVDPPSLSASATLSPYGFDTPNGSATNLGEGLTATPEGVYAEEPCGWRSAREVVAFLRKRGAKIAELDVRVAGEWAALSSEGEGTESDSGAAEELVWVPTGSKLRESESSES